MNEVHDVQPGHIYQPGNKKEVRLVYRILSGPYCGRHQKSFSLTKWGVAGAWDAAQQAKAYMLQTGRLPPSFASPYSRSKLTNASANAIVLSKPLQPPRPLIHPGAVAGGHTRADAAALISGAATGAHLTFDTANAAIAAAASRFLPLETFSAVAAAARSLPPHHTHAEKDGTAPALTFPAFADGLAAPFPSFLPPPTFPGRATAATSPPGSWSYLSSVHATLAAAAMAQRASGAGSAETLPRRENAEEDAATGHHSGSPTLEQENSSGSACAEVRVCGITADGGNGGASVVNSYPERVAAHPSELIGLHMLPSAPGPPPPFTAAPAADGMAGTTLPTSSSTPSAAPNSGTACTTAEVNPAAAAATAFTLLQLAEQNAVLPPAKDQQQLNHNALQHFMLLHQLQVMQDKQQKDTQQRQGGHEGFCHLKPSPLQGYSPTEVDAASGEGTETAGTADETREAAETDRHMDAACAASAPASADSDITRAASGERWQNQNCSQTANGSAPPPPHDAAQLGQGGLSCQASPDALSQGVGPVAAAHDNFGLPQDQRRHQQQHHAQHEEPHKQGQQDHPQNGHVFAEEGNIEATPGMRETLRDLLIAASLQQQRLHQQQFAVAEHLHNHHPPVASLAIKGLPIGRSSTATPAPPGMLNISALASLLPGTVLSHKHQTTTDGMLTQSSSPDHTEGNSIGRGCCVHAGPGGEREPADPSALAEEKPSNTLLSEGIHAAKDVGFPSQVSILWGIPHLDHLAVKNGNTVATAAAAGHCGVPSASTVGPPLETPSALASTATLDGEHFKLLDDSVAGASAGRLKGLSECAGVILHHPATSSSQAAADVDGECEAMSSCQSGNGEECEKGAEGPLQPGHISGEGRQPSLLHSLSPPSLQMLPAGSAAASPLRLAAAMDGGAVNVAASISNGGRCQALMHSSQHGINISPMTARERATAVSADEGAAAVSDAATLQICSSPNNTPSRTSGNRVQSYCADAAAADTCSHLRSSGCSGSEDVLVPRDTDTRGQNTGDSSLVSDALRGGQSMVVETSVTITDAHEINSCGKVATDAAAGERLCNPTLVTREGKSRDCSDCAAASAVGRPDSPNVFDELATDANEVTRNDTDTEDENCNSSTRSNGLQELTNRHNASNPSRSNKSELRGIHEGSLTAGPDPTAAPQSCWMSCIKRTRTGRCAYGSVTDSLSSDSQDEEQIVRTRSRTTDVKKHTSGSADAGRIRLLGKHNTKRKMCF